MAAMVMLKVEYGNRFAQVVDNGSEYLPGESWGTQVFFAHPYMKTRMSIFETQPLSQKYAKRKSSPISRAAFTERCYIISRTSYNLNE